MCFSIQSQFFSKRDVELLISHGKQSGFRGVDVLVTADWPRGITRHTQPPVSWCMYSDMVYLCSAT